MLTLRSSHVYETQRYGVIRLYIIQSCLYIMSIYYMCQYIFLGYGYIFVCLVELPQWGGSIDTKQKPIVHVMSRGIAMKRISVAIVGIVKLMPTQIQKENLNLQLNPMNMSTH